MIRLTRLMLASSILIGFFGTATAAGLEYNPSLTFSVRRATDTDAVKKISVTLAELKQNLKNSTFTVNQHPVYSGRAVTYAGFYFKEVIQYAAKKTQAGSVSDYVYSLWASDNFSAFIEPSDLQGGEAFLAWKEIGADSDPSTVSPDGLWTLVEKHGNPGPFYLVWNNPEKTYWQKWPFKLVDLTFISQDILKTFNSLAPGNDFVLNKGYTLAVKNCTACHQIAGKGFSQMAGDLSRLAQYRSVEAFVKQIRKPLSRMVPFTKVELSDDDIRAIHQYLKSLK